MPEFDIESNPGSETPLKKRVNVHVENAIYIESILLFIPSFAGKLKNSCVVHRRNLALGTKIVIGLAIVAAM